MFAIITPVIKYSSRDILMRQDYCPVLFPFREFLKGLAVQDSDYLPLNFQYAIVLHLS